MTITWLDKIVPMGYYGTASRRPYVMLSFTAEKISNLKFTVTAISQGSCCRKTKLHET
jgi:hypothetical protein